MKELVSQCCSCGKDLFCLDGFFNGVYTENQETICFECEEDKAKSAE